METNITEMIDTLESLQYKILFWKRKESDKGIKNKLGQCDMMLDEIIETLNDI